MTRDAGIERAVFHWYSGPPDILREILASGYFVSATPALARSPAHSEAMAIAPIERILVETDCPVSFEGRPSEPANLVVTIRELARIKGLDFPAAANITRDNLLAFYGLDR